MLKIRHDIEFSKLTNFEDLASNNDQYFLPFNVPSKTKSQKQKFREKFIYRSMIWSDQVGGCVKQYNVVKLHPWHYPIPSSDRPTPTTNLLDSGSSSAAQPASQ